MTVHVHAGQHQNGGIDEITVEDLSGELADDQPALAHDLAGVKHLADTLADLNLKVSDATLDDEDDTRTPKAHKTSHQNGGTDEISVAGLSGELADEQSSAWAKVSGKPSTFDPVAHKTSHQNVGTDEINVAGLSGELADEQPSAWAKVSGKPSTFDPSAHKTSHAGGGADKLKYTRQLVWVVLDATLATGTDQSGTIVYRGPTLTLVRWDARVKTAPTDADLILDVLVGGTSLWASTPANRPTIADAATSGTGTSFDTTTISDGDVCVFDIDQVGSTIAGGQVTLLLEGECNPETD